MFFENKILYTLSMFWHAICKTFSLKLWPPCHKFFSRSFIESWSLKFNCFTDVFSILFSNTLKFYFLQETVYYIACLSDKLMWVIWNNLKIYFINFLACTTHIQYTFINYIYHHLFLSYMQYLSNFLSNCILSCFLLVIKLFSIEICSMSFLYIQCKFIIKCPRKCKLHFRISINISHMFYKCYASVKSDYIWKFLFMLYVKI